MDRLMREARLTLDDGTVFRGWSFGYEQGTAGEVVFNTAMTGYPESLTDPSYAGQILVMTYPLIGNYGVPCLTREALPVLESHRIHPKALVVADYSTAYAHWDARESLADWLKREKVTAITGVDTRRLTEILREHGVMMGRIVINEELRMKNEESGMNNEESATAQMPCDGYGAVNWVEKVSCKEVIAYNKGAGKRVVLVDCGVKANIIRCLIRRGLEVVRVPWNYDFNQMEFDGLLLANGPGDPEQCGKTVENIRTFLDNETVRPCMGICLGNQLLARAAGAKTYKMKYGHRSHNQPVMMVGGWGTTINHKRSPMNYECCLQLRRSQLRTMNCRCFITSQNHGYAVDDTSLPADWEPLFVNMNDGSNEGIRHKTNPWFSAQFHPEACSGPTDTEWLFDEFVNMLRQWKE